MKIRAAVVNGVNQDYNIEEVNIEEPRLNEVLVKIVAAGICHSDEAFRLGEAAYTFPAVFGHEGAGIVEKVGEAVTDIKPGDHVVISYAYCGKCKECREGHPSTCEKWPLMNFGTRIDGTTTLHKLDGENIVNILGQASLAEYTLVHENNITKVDDDVDLRYAGPLGCGFLTGLGAVYNGIKPEPNSSMIVFGTGTVGDACIMAAKAIGCNPIIAIDIHEHRLDEALELGATHKINSSNCKNVLEEIHKICNGGMSVIDTTGVESVMKLALDATAQGGTYAPLAVTSNDLTMKPFLDLVATTKTIKGVLMGNAVPQVSIKQMLDLNKAGLFPFEKICKFYDFEDVNEAANDSNSGKTLKPILIVDKEYTPNN